VWNGCVIHVFRRSVLDSKNNNFADVLFAFNLTLLHTHRERAWTGVWVPQLCPRIANKRRYPCHQVSQRYLREVPVVVVQLVEALRLKPEGRGFDSRLCHWNFSLT